MGGKRLGTFGRAGIFSFGMAKNVNAFYGGVVVTDDANKFDRARIVQAMVGRDLSNTLYGRRKTTMRPAGARVLTVQNLKMAPMVRNNVPLRVSQTLTWPS